jgi:hypothetical protein
MPDRSETNEKPETDTRLGIASLLAKAALSHAKPQSQNGFKVELAKRCLVHALKLVTQSA